MGKAAVAIDLAAAGRSELVLLAQALKAGQAMERRAWIALSAAAGLENKAICVEVGADANTVSKRRPGTPRKISDDSIADTVRWTLETTPPCATH